MYKKETKCISKIIYLCKKYQNFYHKYAVKTGVSDSCFFVMFAIFDLSEGCTQTDIIAKYNINKQSLSSAVKYLVSEDYINLKHGKGRTMHIFFSEKGKTFIHDYILPVINLQNEVLLHYSKDEVILCLEIIEKIFHDFEQMMSI